MSFADVLDATVLLMKELDEEAKAALRSTMIMSSVYDDREKKFMMKTTLYDSFWRIKEAVDDGFNVYLNDKMNYYHHLSEYHKINCPKLHGDYPCSICDTRIKNYDLLLHGDFK